MQYRMHGNNDFGGIGAVGNDEIIGRIADMLVGNQGGDAAERALMQALAISGDDSAASPAAAANGQVQAALAQLLGGGGDLGGAGNVGEAIRMALARKIDPNAVQVRDRGYRERRRFPLGFNTLTLAAGAVDQTIADPQDLFRAERLIVPSDIAFGFQIEDVKVGTESQLVSQGPIPAAAFTEVAVDAYLHFRSANIGNTITLIVRNISNVTATFRACLIGTAAR